MAYGSVPPHRNSRWGGLMRKPIPLGVKAFARLHRVSPAAVRRAARDGRLTEASIEHNARGHLIVRDPAMAWSEWKAHTRVRIGIDSQAHRGPEPRVIHPAVAAYFDLQALILQIEKRLDVHLKFLVKQIPAAPDTTWAAVHEEWEKLPDALERLQNELKAVPLFAEEEEE